MTTVSRVAAACAAAPSHTSASAGILQAARLLLPDLERGRRIDAGVLRSAMETAFGASDDQRVEALGAAGMATSENRRAQYARLYSANFTEQSEPYLNFFIERYVEAFNAELGAFADCVETGAAPEVGFEDGRLALVLAEAALKSAREGRLVKVSEVD
jgi:predicted dehydrogenase